VEAPIAEIIRKLGIHNPSDDNRRVKGGLDLAPGNRDHG